MGELSADHRLRIDLVAECIWRDGERFGVPPKAFLVLRHLLERPERLVTKDELLDAVWPETHVIDKVLNIAVGELRHALGDDPRNPRFIATVHRRGFRWIGPSAVSVGEVEEAAETFVGRAGSLAELERRYALASAGQRQLVFVTGEPGIGKSALIDRFLLGVEQRSRPRALVARGLCVDRYGVGESYRPLLDACEALLRSSGGSLPAVFRRHAPSWLLRLHDFLPSEEIAGLQQAVGDTGIERMQRDLERALLAASAGAPIVLVLEDLHWSDLATIGLLGALASGREAARILIVGSYRPFDAIAHQHPVISLKRDLAGKRHFGEVALDGLTSEDVGGVLARRFGRHRFPGSLAARLHAQTSGNPLFLLNALADFVQRGWLFEHDGTWDCDPSIEELAGTVPDSTRDLIALRLDLLPPATQELLEAASLAGMTFASQTVGAAVDRSAAEIDAECSRLAHTLILQQGDEIEWPDGTRGRQHRFRHALFRRVLEDRIAPSRRQLLHRKLAARLELGHGERAGEIAGTLRYHFEQAGDYLRAADCIEVMVQQSFACRAMAEALELHEQAAALLARLPESDAVQKRLMQMRIGVGMLATTTLGVADARTSHAIAALEQPNGAAVTSPEEIAARTMVTTGQIAGGEYRRAFESAGEIVAMAGTPRRAEVAINGLALAGIAAFYLGKLPAALDHLEATLALAAAAPPMRVGDGPLVSAYDAAVPALAVYAQALALAGRADRSSEAVEAALARARGLDMPWYLGWALSGACSAGVLRRDVDEVRRRAGELRAHCGDGQEHLRDVARFMLAWVDALETRDAASLGLLREALDAVLGVPDPMVTSRYLSMFAGACLDAGAVDDAAAAIERALAERGEARFYDAELARQRAAVILAGGGAEGTACPELRASEELAPGGAAVRQAEAILQEAIDVAMKQGAALFALRATVDLCRLTGRNGGTQEARQRIARALAGFRDLNCDRDLTDARELLAT